MKPTLLVRRSLRHYWRTNAAVVAGIAAAVTVLAGALLVGDSVRGSLRDLVVQRLGRTDLLVASTDFFRTELADDLRADASFEVAFSAVCPLVAMQGVVTEQTTGRRSSRVQVYGVDQEFWQFHQRDEPLGVDQQSGRSVLLSPALARDIGAATGSTVLLRVQRPTAIPLESVQGRKDDLGRTLRLTVGAVLQPADLGEFLLQPQQGDVRAIFVPLSRLQQELDLEGRVNVLLVSVREPRDLQQSTSARLRLEELLRRTAALEDIGLRLRTLEPQALLSLEGDGALIGDTEESAAMTAAEALGVTPTPVLTYLVNSIRSSEGDIPYSLVSGLELTTIVPDLQVEEPPLPPIVLNEWAASDLAVNIGSRLTLEYFVWEEPGRLATETAAFLVAAIAPLAGATADRDLAPLYPGITDSSNLRDWDPPFPFELARIRPIDEDYWTRYRTTPKAFIPLNVAQTLWRSRFGSLTSIRVPPPSETSLPAARDLYLSHLNQAIDPATTGLAVRDVRGDGLAASRGATDFGEYFTYFSMFLVVSAVMLAALFFKLGVEQRVREVGLLRAVGFTTKKIRRLFVGEALLLSALGSAIGLVGAVGYGHLMMTGLRTWWIDAVGTTALTLHVSPTSLIAGAGGGIGAALICIWWTLGTLARVSERGLLAGQLATDAADGRADAGGWVRWPAPLPSAIAAVALGGLLLAAGIVELVGRTGAFFGAGASLLVACMSALLHWLQRPNRVALAGHGWWPVARLGLRHATYHPARSVLSIAVIAAATFILISVDAFRRGDDIDSTDPGTGTGGYSLLVDTVLPIVHDPNGPDGLDLLGLSSLEGIGITPFRMLPGDDASCLNLYEPLQPRMLGVPREFVSAGHFAFRGSLDRSEEERANPWLLLHREQQDGSIPVIADANSMTYVLHRKLGEEIVVSRGGRDVRLRLVAALADSIFQGELLMSEANLVGLYPEVEGYSFLLVNAPPELENRVANTIEDRLSDLGADVTSTAQRLSEFHQVENAYLSTFQTLGGLGLLLGTVGLAAVLLRNVLERRRELALLGAVGYSRSHLFVIVIAESAMLLTCGLATGTLCALIAVAPAAVDRGGRLPTGAWVWLLVFVIFATGLVSSVVATRAAIHTRLLDALRSE